MFLSYQEKSKYDEKKGYENVKWSYTLKKES